MCCTIVGMSQSFEPGVYVKGNQTRRCQTPADAVAAVFAGFTLKEDTSEEVTPVEQPSQAATPDPDAAGETPSDEAETHESRLSQFLQH